MSLFSRYFPNEMHFTPTMHDFPTMGRRAFLDRHFHPRRSPLFQIAHGEPVQKLVETRTRHPFLMGEKVDNKIILDFSVSDFKPEEVQVKVIDDNVLQVVAESDGNERGGSKRRHESQYILPKGVLFNDIKSVLSKDGVLTVEIPTLDKSVKN